MSTKSGHTRATRANKAIGTTVRNAAGEIIGKVEDVILDKHCARGVKPGASIINTRRPCLAAPRMSLR